MLKSARTYSVSVIDRIVDQELIAVAQRVLARNRSSDGCLVTGLHVDRDECSHLEIG